MTVKAKRVEQQQGFFQTKLGRTVAENLTAYTFLLPAFLIIFIFNIFPVAFAFIVSLHRWRRFPEGWRGLDSYVDALGNFAYVAFFWLAIAAFLYGLYSLWRMLRDADADRNIANLIMIVPGASWSITIAAFINWFFEVILVIYDIPNRIRGQDVTRELFVSEFFGSFSFAEVSQAANLFLIAIAASLALTIGFIYLLKLERSQHYIIVAATAGLGLIAGAWLMNLTISEVNAAITNALEDGETLPIWSQTIFISAGAGLMGIALWLWNRTVHDQNARFYIIRLLAVVAAVVGSVFLIQYLPQAFEAADEEVFMGFSVTVWYSILSVPFQLTLGLLLAVLLFQKIQFRSFFRVVFFMPYITPFVATSVVFALLFSPSENSLVNQFISVFGIDAQTWLREPQGIVQLMFGDIIPDWAAGPSLALLVIIFYNIWIYAGYSSVIFLAGLGGIPEDVYEAAEIDGATGWQQFRYITIPLLSPTTFFLTLIATIGTFQAFTQIFLMRRDGAFEAVNTINLYIYDEINQSTPDYAYGSAMAFVLFAVILILTIWQNHIAERRVFYG